MNQDQATQTKPGRRRGPVILFLGALVLAYGIGVLSHRQQLFPIPQVVALYRSVAPAGKEKPKGRWYYFRGDDRRPADTPESPAIGYLTAYERATDAEWVTVHDRARLADGHRFFVLGPYPEAHLVNTEGQVVHRWKRECAEIWPGVESDEYLAGQLRDAVLLPDGDLVALYIGYGVVRLDRSSNVIWKSDFIAHHDLELTPDGRLLVLEYAREVHVEQIGVDEIMVDYVTELDLDGHVVARTSVLECFEGSSYWPTLARMPKHSDVFHANAIRYLDGKHTDRLPAFAAGNLLLSLRSLDAVVAVDLEQKKVVWGLMGQWLGQHDPHLLETGNMLVFDNQGTAPFSRVIEFDPLTREVVWTYQGDATNGFNSNVLGTAVRLQNGNTLVAESVAGRVFEVAPDGALVWEFRNPYRSGENDELIGPIYSARRVPAAEVDSWLE